MSGELFGYNANGDTNVSPIGIYGMKLMVRNVIGLNRSFLEISFKSGGYRPLKKYCEKYASLGADGDSVMQIDMKNAEKILNIIKSGEIQVGRMDNPEFVNLFNQITPEVLSK